MREPSRIPGFCAKLASIWMKEAPDLRFAQVVDLVFAKIREDDRDPFYLEEDELIAYAKKALSIDRIFGKR